MSDPKAVLLHSPNERAENESSSLSLTRRLVLKYGWNSTSYQIINRGIRHWFARANDAVVGFVSCVGVRVVAGAPVCGEERLAEVSAEFELDAAEKKERVCYFAAEEKLELLYRNSPNYSRILLGAQPVWHPHRWAAIVSKNKSLRAQLNRARNKGVIVSEWSTERAHNNPELLYCLREWLAEKGLPPLHFLVEPQTLSRLYDRRVFVAECGGKVVGFVVLSPIKRRSGWLFEQFVHKPNSPNGTVELMIDYAMRVIAEDGYEYVTLGLSPLSQRAQTAPFRNPLWLRILLAWIRKHGERFYNFNGLDNFKAKLQPETWEPIFAVSKEPQISLRTLYAIASAFSANAPVRLVLGGMWRALLTEIKWLKQSVAKIFLK